MRPQIHAANGEFEAVYEAPTRATLETAVSFLRDHGVDAVAQGEIGSTEQFGSAGSSIPGGALVAVPPAQVARARALLVEWEEQCKRRVAAQTAKLRRQVRTFISLPAVATVACLIMNGSWWLVPVAAAISFAVVWLLPRRRTQPRVD